MKQLSIYINNSNGKIADVISILDDNDIKILALSVSDVLDYGMLRLIVNSPDKAYELLRKEGFNLKIANTLGFYLDDNKKLSSILNILKDNNISITYIYSFMKNVNDSIAYIIKTPNLDVTESLMKDNGFYAKLYNSQFAE